MNDNLVTWATRNQRICYPAEIDFMKKYEKDSYISMVGHARFIHLLKFLKHIDGKPREILDIGGNLGTARWLEAKFPGSIVTILNISPKETAGWGRTLRENAENFKSMKKYDLIFAGDILEHTYNPDGVIASAVLALKSKGYLIISTPNLACIYNRIFLLLGWSPIGYYPSLRYMTGNPFFRKSSGDFGIVMDHKSVFTWKGLSELLGLYQLTIKKTAGYDISPDEQNFKVPAGRYKSIGVRIRTILNWFLPKSMRVGMMFLCQVNDKIDTKRISAGILDGSIWN